MLDPLYSLAFITGLLGSGHCLGMCGPLVAALGLAGRAEAQGLLFHLLYNGGRLLTYSLLGLAAGLIGAGLVHGAGFAWFSFLLLLASDLFIIAVGLGVAGLLRRCDLLEMKWAAPTALITRGVRRLAGLSAGLAGLPLGLLMGFLPCGLLYAMLLAAAQSGTPAGGLLTMFFFGLGTIPALFAFGSAAHLFSGRSRARMLRIAGWAVVLMGAYNIYRHVRLYAWLLGDGAPPDCH